MTYSLPHFFKRFSAALLFTTALGATAFAQSLPDISPDTIAQDVERRYDERTGVAEYVAQSFDPFENDETLAGSAALRSANEAVTIDGDGVQGGAFLDVSTIYTTGSDDPYDVRGYEDAVFTSGLPVGVIRYNSRTLDCSRDVREVRYDDSYYNGAAYGYIAGIYRLFPRYRGHRHYGWRRGYRGHRGYGHWRRRGHHGYGHGDVRRRRGGHGDDGVYRRRRGGGDGDVRRRRPRDGDVDRPRRRPRDGDVDRRRPRDGSGDVTRRRPRDGDVDRPRRRPRDGDVDRRRPRDGSGDVTRRRPRDGDVDRPRRRPGNGDVTRRRPTTPDVDRPRRRPDVDRPDRRRPERRRAGGKPDTNGQPLVYRRPPNLDSAVGQPARRKVKRPKRRDTAPVSRPRRDVSRPKVQTPVSRPPVSRPKVSKPKSSPPPVSRKRVNRKADQTFRNNRPRTNRTKHRNFYPMVGGYTRTDVYVNARCVKEETLIVHIPQERLDAARFDGFAVILLDRDGREMPVFVPPNYVEGFRKATGRSGLTKRSAWDTAPARPLHVTPQTQRHTHERTQGTTLPPSSREPIIYGDPGDAPRSGYPQ